MRKMKPARTNSRSMICPPGSILASLQPRFPIWTNLATPILKPLPSLSASTKAVQVRWLPQLPLLWWIARRWWSTITAPISTHCNRVRLSSSPWMLKMPVVNWRATFRWSMAAPASPPTRRAHRKPAVSAVVPGMSPFSPQSVNRTWF